MDCCKVFRFLFTLALELIDLVLDWEFYYEISKTDEVNYEVQSFIFAFAVVGSFLFFLIVANKIDLFCCKEYGDDEEENALSIGLSLLSTIFEDIPQIVLAIIVALTTKELVSPVQIAKAGYAILEPFIQIVMNAVEIHDMNKTYKHNKGRKHCKIIEIFISVILMICSITLLINLVTMGTRIVKLDWKREETRSVLSSSQNIGSLYNGTVSKFKRMVHTECISISH